MGCIATAGNGLIVFFLFKEGLGLIGKAPVEDGIIVATGKGNKIQNISAIQIKDVFDTKISNWKELGGKDDTIIVFRIENITNYYPEDSIGKNFENLPRLINNIFLANR